MPSPTTPRGIGYYLVALILLAVVPLVIIAGILIWRQGEVQREAFERSLLQTAAALSVAVDQKLDSYRVMLDTLVQSEPFARDDLAGFHAVASRVANVHGALFVSLFDADGKQVLNTLTEPGRALPTPFKDTRFDDPEKPPVGDASALKQTLATGQPVNSDLVYGLVAQRYIFLMNVPVVREGRIAYVLNAAFTPDAMTRLLQESPEFGGVPAVIFDRRGFIVGRWDNAQKYVGTKVRSWRMHAEGQRDSFVGMGETLEDDKIYYSYVRSKKTGWGVNVGAEVAKLERELRTVRTVGFALAGGGLILGLLLALSLAGRLRGSIAALAESASRRDPPRVRGLRTREVAELERALADSAMAREAQARERENRLIAEARKAEAEEAGRMKDHFIAVLSHELRNPLAPVRTGVHVVRELLQQGKLAEIKEVVEVLDRQSEQLARLVNDLLDVARINTGHIVLERRPIDLRDVVRHAVETAAPGVQARGHRLQVDLPDAALPVSGDFARLSQVVSNLLDNAVKYTPAGGDIHLSLRAEAGAAVLKVVDTGRGIDARVLPGLFTAGARGVHGGESGLGLGLALARGLVELHGGSLQARSAGAGKGSEFEMRLPLLNSGTEP